MAADREGSAARTVFRVWPDYTLYPHLDRSVSTVKSDAALRSYAATGGGVTWAVVNSGIDQQHPHFAADTLTGAVAKLHYDFTSLLTPRAEPPRNRDAPLLDPQGHGTHVAGIIAGAVPNEAVRSLRLRRWPEPAAPGSRPACGNRDDRRHQRGQQRLHRRGQR